MTRFSTSIFILMLGSFTLNAQNLLTNNNALFAITRGAAVTIQGDATNSGTIRNEGALRLYGNWANSGEYSSVSGTFFLEEGSSSFEPGNWSYNYLSVNSASGVSITSDLIISETLELISGTVTLPVGTGIYLEENAGIIGGDANSYINGTLYSSQQGDLYYPIGSGSEFLPVELYAVESTLPVGINAFSEDLALALPQGIDGYSPNRFWQLMDNENFSATGIRLPVINESFIENANDAVILFAPGLNNAVDLLGAPSFIGSTSSGLITTNASIQPGYFLIGDKGIGGPPITVINVITSLQDGKHDFLRIENIEFYEDNVVEIFDRNGNKVFSISGYNNTDRVFRGEANLGGRGMLTTGSYFYTVKLTNSQRENGFLYIKN